MHNLTCSLKYITINFNTGTQMMHTLDFCQKIIRFLSIYVNWKLKPLQNANKKTEVVIGKR